MNESLLSMPSSRDQPRRISLDIDYIIARIQTNGYDAVAASDFLG